MWLALAGLASSGALAGAAGDRGYDDPASVTGPAVRVDPPRAFSVMAAGDVMTGYRVRAPAAAAGVASGLRFDFRPQLAEIRPVLESVDLAICHMEVPIGEPGGVYGDVGVSPYGGYRLLAPYEIAAGLRSAGFDRCSTASNHAYDVGVSGIAWTIEAFAAQGMSTVGTARTEAESVDTVFDVDGVAVAHLAFTTYSNTVLPADRWRLNYVRRASTVADRVVAARAAGAEVVIVSLHVSKELNSAPVAEDRAFVSSLTRLARVDAVFIHGPHVVQPIERVNGVPVWWSVGNFFTQMPAPGRYATLRTADGLVARADFLETSPGVFFASSAAVAVCADLDDRTVRSATAGLAAPDTSTRVRSELEGCLHRTRLVVPEAG